MNTALNTADGRPWIPPLTFGARLALIRNHKGWNAKEAAAFTGVKPQSWREWETFGRRPHNYEAICKQIAERTGCDAVWLAMGDMPAPANDRVSERSSVQSGQGAPLRLVVSR